MSICNDLAEVKALNGDTYRWDKEPIFEQRAPAKVNLGLKVLGQRADGFHDLLSICQTVNLCDKLTFHAASRDGMECSLRDLEGPGNLVFRALQLFRQNIGGRPDPLLHIRLEKVIPVGAGLGGGSADAAAVLRAMVEITRVDVDIATLAGWGAELGSDVPFLVRGGTAVIRSRGELVEPVICDHPYIFVIGYPEVSVDTAWAYAQMGGQELTPSSPYASFVNSLGGGHVDAGRLVSLIENDFQPIVERAKPIVAETRATLRSAGAVVASLTGSGSAVYGLFDDRIAASSAHVELMDQGIRSFCCTPFG